MNWQLNRIQYPVYNLGKGKRIAIWVQGCSLACKSCISQTLQTKNGGSIIDIEQLVTNLLPVAKQFDGITITGGEPFQQYQQLIAFCAYLKQTTKLETYVFTGYYLNELLELFPDKLFIKYIDYILDGRYMEEQHDNKNTRGSANQKLYKFEEEKAILQSNYFNSNQFGLKIDDEMQVFMSGIPKEKELEQLSKYLHMSGINLSFR